MSACAHYRSMPRIQGPGTVRPQGEVALLFLVVIQQRRLARLPRERVETEQG